MVERFHLALALSLLPHTRRRVLGRTTLDLEALAPGEPDDDGELVAACAQLLWQRSPGPEQHAALLAYLDDCNARLADLPPRDLRRAKLRGLVQLLIAAPEFAVA